MADSSCSGLKGSPPRIYGRGTSYPNLGLGPQLSQNTSHYLLSQYARPGFYISNSYGQGASCASANYIGQIDEEDSDNHSVHSLGPGASDYKIITVRRSSCIAMKGKSTAAGPIHPKRIVQRRVARSPPLIGNNQSGIPVSGGLLP